MQWNAEREKNSSRRKVTHIFPVKLWHAVIGDEHVWPGNKRNLK